LAAVAGPAIIWLANQVNFSFLHGGINTLGLVIAAGFISFGIFERWSPLLACVVAAAVMPLLALLVREVPFLLAAAMLALPATAVLADSLLRSFLFFKTAAPVPRPRALESRTACRRRWISFLRPLRGAELWGFGFCLIAIAG